MRGSARRSAMRCRGRWRSNAKPHIVRPKAPFNKVPNGIPGLETRLPLRFSGGVVNGRIDPQTFVALTSTTPARLYGLYPRKGTIAVGSDADLVIWEQGRERTIANA